MPDWVRPPQKSETVGVLLFPRFSNHCLANAIEPLRAANGFAGRALYDWQFLTLDGGPVRSSSGLPVMPGGRLADSPGGDYLFILPSYGMRDHAGPETTRALRAAARRFRALAGMDTGSWLMAEAGLLDGRRATIHWDELDQFAERFDRVEAVADTFVEDGDRLSCGGVTTTFELVLHLIGRTHGEALRIEVAALFTPAAAVTRPDRMEKAATGSALVDRAVALMRLHLEEPLPLPALAARLGITQRRLEAECARHLGAPPRAVYRRLRLLAARRFVTQTGYSVAEIALRCGYRNPAAMTRAFQREFGTTPTALRRRGRGGNAMEV